MPASDGLFLGEDLTPRRWDGSYLLNVMKSWDPPNVHGNEAHNPSFMAVGDPPAVHGNSRHSLVYTDTVFLSGPYLAAADVSVGSAVAVTIATATLNVSGTREEYLLPVAGFNFRPDAGNTADRRLDVWLEDGAGNQRSAKFPITVVLNDPKRPYTYGLAFSSSLHVGYWQSPKTGSVTVTLKGQTDAETALCSDRFFTLLRFSRQP